ncbi:MAG: YdeI/OmpD-associated family protein [Edaphocola sp.]
MKHTFKAKIYQTGINWCVDVPTEITELLTAEKGRINIKGKINGFYFAKTLMPVKNAPHRLFVNQAMMKGGKTALGETAAFEIEQDNEKTSKEYPTPLMLTEQLKKEHLTTAFDNLTASRKKDILKYLSYVKTEETLLKNIDKLIAQLKNEEKNVRIP